MLPCASPLLAVHFHANQDDSLPMPVPTVITCSKSSELVVALIASGPFLPWEAFNVTKTEFVKMPNHIC